MILLKFNQFIKESISQDILSKIDYTELNNNLSHEHMKEICEKAKNLNVATVCVQPEYVKICHDFLKGSNVGVCTVVSFPQGTNSTEDKIKQCKQVIADGCDEVDMVLNWKELKNSSEKYKGYPYCRLIQLNNGIQEVKPLVKICHENNKILKVIVESGELTEKETEIATAICIDAEADFIKTSTGKVPIGAELSKIKIMYDKIKKDSSNMKIKASGGIRDMQKIQELDPYVDRFGIGYATVDSIFSGKTSTSNY